MYDGETRRCVALDPRLPASAQGSVLCEVAALEGATPLMAYDEDFFAGAPAVAENAYGKGRAYYVATRFEPAFYAPFYALVCEGVIGDAQLLPDNVLLTRRGPFTFLQNAGETPVTFMGVELPKYGTAVLEDGKRIY